MENLQGLKNNIKYFCYLDLFDTKNVNWYKMAYFFNVSIKTTWYEWLHVITSNLSATDFSSLENERFFFERGA